MLRKLLLAALMIVACFGAASGQRLTGQIVEVDVGGRTVKLIVAEGQCVLDGTEQADRSILDVVTRALAGQNELLLHTAECANLAEVRRGATAYLDNFAQAQVLIQLKTRDFRGEEGRVVEQVCRYLRTLGEELQKKVGPDIERRIADLALGIGVNEQRQLGVLDQDEHGCYTGTLMGLSTPSGETRLLLGVYAVTVLNGRIVYLYRFQAQPQEGEQRRLLAVVKAAVKDHISANSEETKPAGR